MKFTAKQIAALVGGRIEGDAEATVWDFAKIEEGREGCLSFLANPKYKHYIYDTQSSIVLVGDTVELERPVGATVIRVKDAYESVARLLQVYASMQPRKRGVDALAFVAPDATVGDGAYIGAFAYVGAGAVIGKDAQIYPHAVVGEGAVVGDGTTLHPGVSVYQGCRIGRRCIVHSGAVIGADGFGFAPTPGGYDKIPQIGIVIIEDDVEVGANTCIDRATMGATVVHSGVKLDNLIQLAHNTEVGSHTVMAAQVGMSGSTKMGEWCMMGGQVGIAGHIHIADHTTAAGKTGITNSVKAAGTTISGMPFMPAREYARTAVILRRLPELYKELADLKKEVAALKAAH